MVRSQCTFSLMIPCIEVFVMLSDTESDRRWFFFWVWLARLGLRETNGAVVSIHDCVTKQDVRDPHLV